jgi:hypothetical protein
MSRSFCLCTSLIVSFTSIWEGVADAEIRPLMLHPANSHYFLFRDRPTILIGSGEHYGAVLNLDFDYERYLDTLAASGLNHTRTFSGAYREPEGMFNITMNTLAPVPGRFISPWARSAIPGAADGGNKFDLGTWNEAYFQRLKGFVGKASEKGIVVEINLFCTFYEEEMWRLSPMNAVNNINEIGKINRTEVYTLDRNGGLLTVHDNLARKMASELNEFDNVYFEICNEPWGHGVRMEWQHHLVNTIVEAEKMLPYRHLLSLNMLKDINQIQNPPIGVSIVNFHYAGPGEVSLNFPLGLALGDNETGFKGNDDTPYRIEAWQFILAGGALLSHLDYSFAVGHEDGSFKYPSAQPGGGSAELRKQLKILKDFIESFDYIQMKPDPATISDLPEGATATVLSKPGNAYAIYLLGKTQIEINAELPAGVYEAKWINTKTGQVEKEEQFKHDGGIKKISPPPYQDDIALKIVSVSD